VIFGKVNFGKVIFDEASFDNMIFDEVIFDKVIFDKVIFNKMSVSQTRPATYQCLCALLLNAQHEALTTCEVLRGTVVEHLGVAGGFFRGFFDKFWVGGH
jgi:inosine/xanthosine triphosphate pyrophosphatase family protein